MSAAKGSLRSMTGYGRGQAVLGPGSLSAELRATNSRFLDIRVRLPRDFNALEAQVRAMAARYFGRGQVDISVRRRGPAASRPEIVVDLEAAGKYVSAAEQLRERFGLEGALTVSSLLDLPGVAQTQEPTLEEGALEAVAEAVEQACAEAAAMREREGAALEAELRQRLEGIGAAVTQIEARAEEVKRGVRERLEKRLATLAPEIEIDPGRIAQEVVLYVDRMDITEETVRLRSHLAQFNETLGARGPIGRKLEFLIQEIGREVNTAGSKAADAPIGRHVVELKTELEKLREQVLNLE